MYVPVDFPDTYDRMWAREQSIIGRNATGVTFYSERSGKSQGLERGLHSWAEIVFTHLVRKPALSRWKIAKCGSWPKYFSNWFVLANLLIINCSSLERKKLRCCYFVFNERYKPESSGTSPGWKGQQPNFSEVWVFRKWNKKCLALLY